MFQNIYWRWNIFLRSPNPSPSVMKKEIFLLLGRRQLLQLPLPPLIHSTPTPPKKTNQSKNHKEDSLSNMMFIMKLSLILDIGGSGDQDRIIRGPKHHNLIIKFIINDSDNDGQIPSLHMPKFR